MNIRRILVFFIGFACNPNILISAPQSIGINTPIISQSRIPTSFVDFRPDIAGAVGPGNDVCVVTNDNVVSITKQGNPGAYDTFAQELSPFFYTFENNQIASYADRAASTDPQFLFDPFSNRWFYTSLGTIAVNNSPTLENSHWNSYSYIPYLINPIGNVATLRPDYDQTGIDQNAIVIGNAIGIILFQKASLLNGGPIVANKFNALFGGNPVGVTNFDTNPLYSYAIEMTPFGVSPLAIFRFANADTPSPTLSTIMLDLPAGDVNVPYFCYAASLDQIPQPYEFYGSCFQAIIDSRVMSPAHIRDNQLYFCENISTSIPVPTGATSIRWYQVDLTDPDNPCVVQFGTITIPDATMPVANTNNFFYPTLMTNTTSRIVPAAESGCPRDVPTHNMTIGFSVGRPNGFQQNFAFFYYGAVPSTGEFYNAATSGRLATDPLGQITLPITYLTNSQNGIDKEFYGDFSSSALDPADQKTIWQFVQWCDAPAIYAIQATQLLDPV